MSCIVTNPYYTTFRNVKHDFSAKENIKRQFVNYDGRGALFECFSVHLYKAKILQPKTSQLYFYTSYFQKF